jgi:GT2 family glycosyltransferase/SAM-dependent methyltransferase
MYERELSRPSEPLVSVVMIFWNAERFIQEAIQSVFAQTEGRWELLLVDDGSTDGSTAIARSCAARYPDCVRYLEHDEHRNQGMSASRNLGIQHARGEYIALLDADDVWFPQKLQEQVAILDDHPDVGMVCGSALDWHSWDEAALGSRLSALGRDIGHAASRLALYPVGAECRAPRAESCERSEPADTQPEWGLPVDRVFEPPQLLTRLYPLGAGPAPCPSTLMVRRETIAATGGFEPQFRGVCQLYEDQAFLAKVYLTTPVFVASSCWTRYRQHAASCVSTVKQAGEYGRVRSFYLRWLAHYLQDQGIGDARVRRTVWAALRPYRYPLLYRLARPFEWRLRRLRGRARQLGARLRIGGLLGPLGRNRALPPPGRVGFGDLRRVTPISRDFGYDRGLPVDRYYIEQFLARHRSLIRGRVLEIGDDSYTRKFGGRRVLAADVLHVEEGNEQATYVGDLTCADQIPSDHFDCFILTQTLHLVYDVRAALQTIYRVLKPGGVVLATLPGISQRSRDQWADYWCWGFTRLSAGRLFAEFFPAEEIEVESHGNVLAATAFLQGLAANELSPEELEHQDPQYEMLITVRAVKAPSGARSAEHEARSGDKDKDAFITRAAGAPEAPRSALRAPCREEARRA